MSNKKTNKWQYVDNPVNNANDSSDLWSIQTGKPNFNGRTDKAIQRHKVL